LRFASSTAAGEGARSTQGRAIQAQIEEQDLHAPPRAVRHKLEEERMSITHKFNVGGHEGYITVGLYPSGDPGEIFITMAKEGSTVSGLMDSFSCAISLSLQHGVPLKMLCEKFAHTRFEPSGWTNNPDIGFAKSIMDYIFRWLQLRFLTGQQQLLFENLRPKLSAGDVGRAPSPAEGDLGSTTDDARRTTALPTTNDARRTTGVFHAADALASIVDLGDAPSCHVCGSIMVRNGSCYKCMSCGSTSGCS
jgi:ribonucleoside-diphosphate reductase alpha chain